ncbi:hypothetical protein CRG98_043389 [Punica granatum]|uniref:Uncharacterized protein n=1 Tax=Punica granatum TaxID=22663 RepID=A0A2I0HX15_PUNGR|nr:hypothetical protein CRG98_043389 [Punica granatum]
MSVLWTSLAQSRSQSILGARPMSSRLGPLRGCDRVGSGCVRVCLGPDRVEFMIDPLCQDDLHLPAHLPVDSLLTVAGLNRSKEL